ncbi:MAG: GNAT family N-acetyltransferase [Pyrinomonadaceae bacterium]
MSVRYAIEPLSPTHDRAAFDCGEPSLDDFLKRFARQNDEKGLSRTYVAVLPGEPKIHGYYSISSGAVRFNTMPEKLPRYPIPVIHLGRLAVDVNTTGLGLGKILLLDALKRAASVSKQLGIYAVEVYALNDAAGDFYFKYGFAALRDDERHLYLTMKAIRKLGLS